MGKKLLAVYIAVSLLLLAALVFYFGADRVLSSLQSVNPIYYLLFALLLVIINLFMAIRIKYVLGEMDADLDLIDALKAHMGGMLASDFTPARSGYFATAAFLSLFKIEGEKALLAIFAPQMFNFLMKVVFSVLAIMLFAQQLNLSGNWLVYVGIAVVFVFVVTGFLVIFSKRFLALFSFSEKIPFAGKFYAIFVKMQEHSDVVRELAAILVGFELWFILLKGIAWYLLGQALGITLPVPNEFVFYFFLQALVILFDFMPTPTIAGAGVTEGALVVILALFGVDTGMAITFGILLRFTGITIDAVGSLPVMKNVIGYIG